jgi:class 3 adenylate cyclase
VLFADVVHSMDIATAVGAERLREIMTELFNRSSALVQRYGGTVDKFTVDGVMAVFGAPVALEDHAIRACLAALDIQSEAGHIAVEVAHCESHAREIPFHVAAGLLRDIFAINGLEDGAARANIRARMQTADSEDLILLDDLLGIRDGDIPLPAIDPDARGRRLAALLNAAAVARTTPAVLRDRGCTLDRRGQ